MRIIDLPVKGYELARGSRSQSLFHDNFDSIVVASFEKETCHFYLVKYNLTTNQAVLEKYTERGSHWSGNLNIDAKYLFFFNQGTKYY